jgi:prolyl-tRNA synthetase
MSKLLAPTLKEDPADAEIISHKLMLRAGMIRKLTAGVYSYLPLGYRSLRKVERICREEMDRSGAQETHLPMVQPAELWRESGRWDVYGKELLRFKDRHGRDSCLGPTHEEVITDIVRRDVRSYRDLPLNLYQIQTKFRDEIRPRFGLMRGREFVMKDAYSFDIDEPAAERSYRSMWEAYCRIFDRCGLKFRPVEADSGPIGGSFSHEFMVLADTGEDTIVSCDSCDYAANMEKAEIREPGTKAARSESGEWRDVETPGVTTIGELADFMNTPPKELIKTLIIKADGEAIAVLLRGDHDLNEVKLRNGIGATEIEMADERTVQEITGGPPGFSGPVGLRNVRIFSDFALLEMDRAIVGANAKDRHLADVNPHSDFEVDRFMDLRQAAKGDPCPRCNGQFRLGKGIEVGHIFKLGTKYSSSMNANALDDQGKEKPIIMGCYGIGVSRIVAAAIEQNHDDDGIIFPPPIAPYSVVVTPVGKKDNDVESYASKVYEQLWAEGVDALLDDRDERPGFKFKDADLIGFPFRITVGKKGLDQGKLEVKDRRSGETHMVELDEVVPSIKAWIADWSKG